MQAKSVSSACAELGTRIRERWKHDWPKIREHRVGGKTYVMVDAGTVDGKRRREVRSTLDEAIDCARAWRDKRDKEGLDTMGLPSAARADAARAWSKLEPHGITLTVAADHYLETVARYKDAPGVSDIVATMLASKEKKGRRPATLKELRAVLGRFAEEFGTRKFSGITFAEIEKYLDRPELSARSQINLATKISQLWNYAKRQGWVADNLVERWERPEDEEKPVGILNLEQCAALLRKAPRFKLLPYAVFGLFFGLRPTELERLDWSAVKIDQKVLTVGAGVAKKRRQRVIDEEDFSDAAVAFLARCKGARKRARKGPIVSPVNFRVQFDAWRKAAGVETWPHDGIRHSFASYHFAAYGDEMRTSRILGHRDPGVFHAHYKGLASKAEGLAFFALRPK